MELRWAPVDERAEVLAKSLSSEAAIQWPSVSLPGSSAWRTAILSALMAGGGFSAICSASPMAAVVLDDPADEADPLGF
ncbi:hypothetical protein [Actinomadura sp. SCN-SB]|uniref:hypothetical protein n=1 Tax=Actinomadura sp. SCN-SB TaxID=3373092 RepID=UPI0037521028